MMKQIFFSNNVITPTFTRISILIKVKHDRQLFFRDRINPSLRNELRLKAKKKKKWRKATKRYVSRGKQSRSRSVHAIVNVQTKWSVTTDGNNNGNNNNEGTSRLCDAIGRKSGFADGLVSGDGQKSAEQLRNYRFREMPEQESVPIIDGQYLIFLRLFAESRALYPVFREPCRRC